MKRIILMGSGAVGKTSIQSVIFANYPPKDTHKIGYTIANKKHRIPFMGNLTLQLQDCGGCDTYMDHYFMVDKQTLFKDVEVIVYVFDINATQQTNQRSMKYLKLAVQSVENYSPNTLVFVLLNKIDLVPLSERQQKFRINKQAILNAVHSNKVIIRQFFATSIWDETLYQAWSQIIQMLIPNGSKIYKMLSQICEASKCEEAVLFQRNTFLIVGCYHKDQKKDMVRYEKISKTIQHFKLTCNKYNKCMQHLILQTNQFCCLIREFSQYESILVVYRDREARTIAQLNISNISKAFEQEKRQFEGHN